MKILVALALFGLLYSAEAALKKGSLSSSVASQLSAGTLTITEGGADITLTCNAATGETAKAFKFTISGTAGTVGTTPTVVVKAEAASDKKTYSCEVGGTAGTVDSPASDTVTVAWIPAPKAGVVKVKDDAKATSPYTAKAAFTLVCEQTTGDTVKVADIKEWTWTDDKDATITGAPKTKEYKIDPAKAGKFKCKIKTTLYGPLGTAFEVKVDSDDDDKKNGAGTTGISVLLSVVLVFAAYLTK